MKSELKSEVVEPLLTSLVSADLMRRQEELRRMEELHNQEMQKRKEIQLRLVWLLQDFSVVRLLLFN